MEVSNYCMLCHEFVTTVLFIETYMSRIRDNGPGAMFRVSRIRDNGPVKVKKKKKKKKV